MPSGSPSPVNTGLTAAARDAAITAAVGALARTLVLDDEERDHVEAALRRLLPTAIERPARDCYCAAARERQVDGGLEIDTDAGVSVSDDGGAYVQAWVWVSHDDLTAAFPHGELRIVTRDGRLGTERWVFYGPGVYGLGMHWDVDGEDETASVAFDLDGEEVFLLDGELWRALEASGRVEEAIWTAFRVKRPQNAVRRLAMRAGVA